MSDPYRMADLEQSLIGAILLDPEAMALVADKLTPDDFTTALGRKAYEVALVTWRRQERVDFLTLSADLGGEDLDSLSYLTVAMANLSERGEPRSAGYYAARIQRAAQIRRLQDAYAAAMGNLLSNPEADPLDAVAGLTDALTAHDRGEGPRSFAELVPEVAIRVEDELDRPELRRVIPTGFPTIDRTLNGGLRPGEVSYWAARTSMGKTALASDIMQRVAQRTGVLFYSLEMQTPQVIRRALSRESGVAMDTIQRASFSDEEWERFANAVDPLVAANIWVDDTPGMTTDRMVARTQRLARQQPVDLVVVDYLELIGDGDDGKQPESSRIAKIVKRLSFLARSCDCHVMVLCQVSRDVETRQDKMPMLSHLTWSRMIEQAADQVFMMNVHDRYVELGLEDPDPDKKGVTDIALAKHRNGSLGRFELSRDPRTFRYVDLHAEDRAYATPVPPYQYEPI